MQRSELIRRVEGDPRLDDLRDECKSEAITLQELLDDVLEDMDACFGDVVHLPSGISLQVIEYNSMCHHFRFKWNSSSVKTNSLAFDTLFEGVEHLMGLLGESDARCLWDWYVEEIENGRK